MLAIPLSDPIALTTSMLFAYALLQLYKEQTIRKAVTADLERSEEQLYKLRDRCLTLLKIHPEESLRAIQEDIGDWAETNIKGATWRGNLRHIQNEVLELWGELETAEKYSSTLEPSKFSTPEKDRIRKELADIVVLCCHAARLLRVDLVRAVLDKMVINKKRSWSKPDSNGVIHHTNAE